MDEGAEIDGLGTILAVDVAMVLPFVVFVYSIFILMRVVK